MQTLEETEKKIQKKVKTQVENWEKKMMTLFASSDPFRVLNEHWVPDAQVSECQEENCKTLFTFYRRKHHCRRYPF